MDTTRTEESLTPLQLETIFWGTKLLEVSKGRDFGASQGLSLLKISTKTSYGARQVWCIGKLLTHLCRSACQNREPING